MRYRIQLWPKDPDAQAPEWVRGSDYATAAVLRGVAIACERGDVRAVTVVDDDGLVIATINNLRILDKPK